MELHDFDDDRDDFDFPSYNSKKKSNYQKNDPENIFDVFESHTYYSSTKKNIPQKELKSQTKKNTQKKFNDEEEEEEEEEEEDEENDNNYIQQKNYQQKSYNQKQNNNLNDLKSKLASKNTKKNNNDENEEEEEESEEEDEKPKKAKNIQQITQIKQITKTVKKYNDDEEEKEEEEEEEEEEKDEDVRFQNNFINTKPPQKPQQQFTKTTYQTQNNNIRFFEDIKPNLNSQNSRVTPQKNIPIYSKTNPLNESSSEDAENVGKNIFDMFESAPKKQTQTQNQYKYQYQYKNFQTQPPVTRPNYSSFNNFQIPQKPNIEPKKPVIAPVVKKEEPPKPIEQPKPQPQRRRISEFDLINQDPTLKNYEHFIRKRVDHYKRKLHEIESNEQSLVNFSKSYEKMGVHAMPNGEIHYREYAPGCKGVSLYGDFNNWKKDQYWAVKDKYGRWELIIPSNNGQPIIKHNQKIKVNVVLQNNNWVTRNPIWSNYLIQNKKTYVFDDVFWNPPTKYQWRYPKMHMKKPKSLRVYEAHVGMATKDKRVGTYREFADNIIPRIKKTGYNAVQLMAIMEHAEYSSFGYHVNAFFAISSRFGSPEDLMYLVDKAHENNIFVIMDIVHSHASSNVDDGFNMWDGTDYLYFHSGEAGKHILWDSRLFNYNQYETLRLLLSNCAYYMNVYHFDGYRFDGITSILYKNHGINYGFSGAYHEYYGDNFCEEGGVYLMLANKLIHQINPDAITIAEDVSGMPGLCRPVEEGGFGFDYRLNMSICDKWIILLKEISDEYWNMGNIVYTCTNRRPNEKHIGYCESHDQSIVGDKTISMWLFDKEVYWNMSVDAPETLVINRGMALHKMIRMITFALGGEGYLCFMGNEWGHPEWVDFPRPGNGFSYDHCCRRWDLVDNGYLRYKYLFNWDVAMNKLDEVFVFICSPFQYVSTQHEADKVIVFEKGDLLFAFNFHPTKSYENYRIGTKWGTEHRIILDSDEGKFFGKDRLKYSHDHRFPCLYKGWNNRPYSMNVYLPARTCMVLIAEENEKKYNMADFEKYNQSLFF